MIITWGRTNRNRTLQLIIFADNLARWQNI